LWVDPEGASIDGQDVFSETVHRGDWLYYGKGPEGGVSNSTGTRRFTEWALPNDSFTYVGGTCRATERSPGIEIGLGTRDKFYVIDTDGHADVVKGLKGREIWLWIGALVAIAAGGWFSINQGLRQDITLIDVAIAASVFLLIWLIGWLVNIRNTARELENRVQQAWSLVDVQLKRRYDLIPGLVSVAKGSGEHEARVQTLVADLRAGNASVVTEKYPDLQAAPAYRKLMEELTDTEDRLALARGFHTEALSLFRTHMEKFPDGVIARFMGIRSTLLE
ncbi:LemA family protein, partial [bacterium]